MHNEKSRVKRELSCAIKVRRKRKAFISDSVQATEEISLGEALLRDAPAVDDLFRVGGDTVEDVVEEVVGLEGLEEGRLVALVEGVGGELISGETEKGAEISQDSLEVVRGLLHCLCEHVVRHSVEP